MGSEQSSQANPSQALRLGQLRRGKSVPESKRAEQESMDTSRPGSISPGPSVCSDSDLPYISYTVNRPIGDSPKLPAKQQGQLSRGKSLGAASGLLSSPGRRVGLRKPSATRPAPPSPAHNIVVVKPAATQETADKDVDILRLQSIPMFLPIMRGTLTLPAARDPEVLERLDPGALYHLCLHYQNHLNHCAQLVADDQAIITHRIKEVSAIKYICPREQIKFRD
uniref:BLOC-1-related complex subunit 5 n=1 Tax=Homalodisca liturata TaxID=320908 RepID=A0A1B6JUM5_9HEMI